MFKSVIFSANFCKVAKLTKSSQTSVYHQIFSPILSFILERIHYGALSARITRETPSGRRKKADFARHAARMNLKPSSQNGIIFCFFPRTGRTGTRHQNGAMIVTPSQGFKIYLYKKL
jgi:hypothetical protein